MKLRVFKSFWLFLTLPLTLPIWKPFSFYRSSKIFRKNTDVFFDAQYFQSFFRRPELFFQFLDSGSRLAISVMNLSIYFFIVLQNISENYLTKICWRDIYDKNIWQNIYDENIWRNIPDEKYLPIVFRRKYLTKLSDKRILTRYLWPRYFDTIFMAGIFRRNISDEHILTNNDDGNILTT